MSGAKAERPGLEKVLDISRAGDTLVIWRLDRLGRSLKDLIAISETLKARDIGLKSLEEGIDTNTSTGQLMFHLFGQYSGHLLRTKMVDRDKKSNSSLKVQVETKSEMNRSALLGLW